MTIAELIAELQKLPPDYDVRLKSADGMLSVVMSERDILYNEESRSVMFSLS